MIRLKHVYVIQKQEDEGLTTYIATFPAFPDMGGISDTHEGAIDALKSAFIGILRDVEADEELEDEEISNEAIIALGNIGDAPVALQLVDTMHRQ